MGIEDVKELKESRDLSEVNQLLKDGWKLIETKTDKVTVQERVLASFAKQCVDWRTVC